MKILDRYIFGSFLVAFLLTFVVLSFVLTVGSMMNIARFIMDGGAFLPVLKFAVVGFHETLQWSLPLSLLFASVLVFSRLSSDNEVMALRASGVGLWRIIWTPLVFSIVLAGIGIFLACEVLPREHILKGQFRRQILMDSDMRKVMPGNVVDVFSRIKFIFDGWENGELVNLQLWGGESGRRKGLIHASRATIDTVGNDVVFGMKDMFVDPLDASGTLFATADRFQLVWREASRPKRRSNNCKDMRLGELLDHLQFCHQHVGDLAEARMNLSLRFVYAVSSFVFAVIGIPLGLLCYRRHSSFGLLIALLAALGYYLLIIGLQTLPPGFVLSPECLICALPLLWMLAGFLLMRRFR